MEGREGSLICDPLQMVALIWISQVAKALTCPRGQFISLGISGMLSWAQCHIQPQSQLLCLYWGLQPSPGTLPPPPSTGREGRKGRVFRMGSRLDLGCADVNHCGRGAREANASTGPPPVLSPMEAVSAGDGITLAGEHLQSHASRGDTRGTHQVFLFLGLPFLCYWPHPEMFRGASQGWIPLRAGSLVGSWTV